MLTRFQDAQDFCPLSPLVKNVQMPPPLGLWSTAPAAHSGVLCWHTPYSAWVSWHHEWHLPSSTLPQAILIITKRLYHITKCFPRLHAPLLITTPEIHTHLSTHPPRAVCITGQEQPRTRSQRDVVKRSKLCFPLQAGAMQPARFSAQRGFSTHSPTRCFHATDLTKGQHFASCSFASETLVRN